MPRAEIHADFHNHTPFSDDGGVPFETIEATIVGGPLQVVGITDHDGIAPQTLELAQRYPGKLIVGEEVTTLDNGKESEIIGLYLKEAIEPGMSTIETAHRIKDQGGLLYIPHPLDRRRKGLPLEKLNEVHRRIGIDVIERYNPRSFTQRYGRAAIRWAHYNLVPTASSSDAHGPHGWGSTYTVLEEIPTVETLTKQLSYADYVEAGATIKARLHPSENRRAKKKAFRQQEQHQQPLQA